MSNRSREQLEDMRRAYSAPPRLGCFLSSHRDLGFCAYCVRPQFGSYRDLVGRDFELAAWRLLSMAERGVPPQPEQEVTP